MNCKCEHASCHQYNIGGLTKRMITTNAGEVETSYDLIEECEIFREAIRRLLKRDQNKQKKSDDINFNFT